MVLGVNQSWRVFPDVDAHVFMDADQTEFDNPLASGFGGRDFYTEMHRRRAVFHDRRVWTNFGVGLDRHDATVFARFPFKKRHRSARGAPPVHLDGGVALKPDPVSSKGSSGYVAVQLAAACEWAARIWMVGFDMSTKKFDGAQGWTAYGKQTPTNIGAWSNSDHHDRVWSHVPPDVRERVRVIEPSTTQVLTVVPWPWGQAA